MSSSSSFLVPFPSLRLWSAVAILSTAAGFNFGFQLIITNPAQDAFISFLNSSMTGTGGVPPSPSTLHTIWGVYVALFFLGSVFGSFLVQVAADRAGRKWACVGASTGQAVGCSMAIVAYFVNSHILYAVSRFIFGLFQAVYLGVAPAFLSECSCLALVLSGGFSTQSKSDRPSPFVFLNGVGSDGGEYSPPPSPARLAHLPRHSVFPSLSPLNHYRKRIDEAVQSFQYFHGVNKEEAARIVEEEEEKLSSSPPPVGMLGVFLSPSTRWPVVIASVVMLSMMSTGFAAITAYAYSLLHSVGLSSEAASWGNVGVSSLLVVGTGVSSLLVDGLGRRPLLLSTVAAILVANVAIVVLMVLYDHFSSPFLGYILLAVICLMAVVFAAGPCPLAMFLGAELCGVESRGSAMASGSVIMAGASVPPPLPSSSSSLFNRTVILAGFPPLTEAMGTPLSYGILFIPLSIVCFVFLFLRLPETNLRKLQ